MSEERTVKPSIRLVDRLRETGQEEAAARIAHLELVIRAVMEAIDDQDHDGAWRMCREGLKNPLGWMWKEKSKSLIGTNPDE
jgi:hypothetical protein